MTYAAIAIQEFLTTVYPFDQLPPSVLEELKGKVQLLRYRMGQTLLTQDVMPTSVSVLYQGQVRLLGMDAGKKSPVTLKLLEPGEVVGWVGLVRGVACETAIASTESICLNLPASDFQALLKREPAFAAALRDRPALSEVFDLLAKEADRRADAAVNLGELVKAVFSEVLVWNLLPGKASLRPLDTDRVWLFSGGSLGDLAVGDRVDAGMMSGLQVGSAGARLVGLPPTDWFSSPVPVEPVTSTLALPEWQTEIPYATDLPTRPQDSARPGKYPLVQARGPLDATLACFQMLTQYFGMPFRRDMLRKIVANQVNQSGGVSLQFCGAVAELMGLTAQLVQVPADVIHRIQTPALIGWQDSFAVVYKASDQELVLAVPEMGIIRRKPKDFAETWGESGEVLLMQPTKSTPRKRFGLSWFIPALSRHRKVLIEVLIASMFVQLLGLVNPIVTQVIIDKVLTQNSLDALTVLGIFLVVVSIIEGILTNVRTHLFADTTNRIDLALSSEVISHLLKLPLRYFERRPVGELATRVNELENIRQFLTGTALTVVLDAVFSVVYIVVMIIYSWLLTLVSLATVPLFILLTLIVSPLMRKQYQEKAERHAVTHSYLVETLAGIQTVKAQNLELRSRWQWQDRYSHYISAGFATVSTQTTAGSLSGFLNKLSSLLVLWAGAYLVISGQMTLGQLIAFRIIAGYVTSPLLRLVQLWQNFQETALSLERLSDILDTPPEQEEAEQNNNILMPAIEGHVKYENVSFSFRQGGALQLQNVNIDFPAGTFVGIVGQSGSGKSTLTKLMARLYEPQSGKIVIDDYDISKVELYSLRRQVGMVLQDTLLFDGSVRENIALTNPDATDDQIIAAAKVAFAHDFIMSLPNGYNTRVGERGSSLSGGQRQRVAIARTVLQDPNLLILDEATSALDYNAERQVCLNLANAFQGRTVFFITHRLSTIRSADVILMMDQGTIVEQGTHDELMALKGYYYCLYQQQETQL